MLDFAVAAAAVNVLPAHLLCAVPVTCFCDVTVVLAAVVAVDSVAVGAAMIRFVVDAVAAALSTLCFAVCAKLAAVVTVTVTFHRSVFVFCCCCLLLACISRILAAAAGRCNALCSVLAIDRRYAILL